MCPKDSGFVMILKHLPKIRFLLNEKGGNILETYQTEKKKLKATALSNIQVACDQNMTKNAMKAILTMCPNLKSLHVKSDNCGKDESWVEMLGKVPNKIQEIHVTRVNFKGAYLCQYVLDPFNGAKLTTLDIREMCFFRLSWFQMIKRNCQNLQNLSIGKFEFV